MQLVGRTLDLARPQLVGILNLTPDSFSDGGELPDLAAVIGRAEQLVAAGADLLDVGGESTRPGAQAVPVDEELARVIPAIAQLTRRFAVPVSIDTRKCAVARAALSAGAAMVNDTSGAVQPEMAALVAQSGAGWVLMHAPHPMGQMGWSTAVAALPADPASAVAQIAADLQAAVQFALSAGVDRRQLAIDPGIGFGKSVAHNLALLRPQPALGTIGLPLYLGPSRKSFLHKVLRANKPADPRDLGWATAAAVTAAVLAGAALVRVHDVAAMRHVVDVATALRDAVR